MAETLSGPPLFQARADLHVAARPEEIYAVVSDLPRSGEWSTECTGGRWIAGTPGSVGAVFQGENLRGEDVVAWAPVVRGTWTTEAEVVAAEPGKAFRWAMRDSAGRTQDSVWSFEVEPDGDGSTLVHHFRMGRPTEGIRKITADMDEAERTRFFAEWGTKVQSDLADTLQRVKVVIEKA
ncbi:SRPBCC family protein [Dactylosporangium fulvum]|uniref:SRPBCC family protein n=1 Tax=Dactylosporangium fulvum TaxID=53359 RepID=A0ABY5WCJ1_9ACTN|nr:SRPBCC family protein [Dactylosporangium fulvum]UWP87125.1 SRPBCC family protein [Dactylosporangium fulvum]